MKESRRKQIETLLEQRQSMTMQELCDAFGVSMNTIRADVASLVSTGALEKIYGGVRVKERKEVPLFTSRSMKNTDQKQRIARMAARLIENGDIIYLDAGTTTMQILNYLPTGIRITVVTPSLPVIIQAHEMANINLVVLPGMYNRRTNSLLDGGTAAYLTQYQHTKAFMGVSSLSATGNLGVSSYQEHELKRTAVSRSQQVYLLADSSKYGEAGLMSYGTVADLTGIFVDRDIPDSFVDLCREQGTQVEIV